MDKNNVLDIYDEDYAQSYNQKFLLNDWFASDVEFERETIGKLLSEIGEDARWLDVACGTGYFLSCFPEVDRAGLDISPAMLKVAKQENPGIPFVEGDFKNKRPQWKEKWDVVSCMWEAYIYVESLPQLERVIENLAEWTSNRGVCFLPICDPQKLGNGEIKLPYLSQNLDLNEGNVRFEAVTWSWIEKNRKEHLNMLAPQVEYMVTLFTKYFEQVEVVEYPLFEGKQRKAIIARNKKQNSIPNKQKVIRELEGVMSSFFRIVRADNWWLYKLPPLLSIAYAETLLTNIPLAQSIKLTLALLFSISSLFAYGHVVNDIFDVEVDQKVGKSNAMIGRSWWQRALFCVIFVITGFVFPVTLNFGVAASVLLGINYLLPTLYSAPPFRFKEKGILGIISDAAGAHAIPTLFIATTFSPLVAAPPLQATGLAIAATAWSFFAGVRGILLHQLWDRNDDLQSGVKTLVTESDVENVRFWMSRIIFPIELLLLGSLILVISHATPLVLVFSLFYFLLKLILAKSDPASTLDPAPVQKSYVIPHDFYEVGLPLVLATALSLQNSWFTSLLLLQVILFYPGIEQRITNLVQTLRSKPQDLNPLQVQLNASQAEVTQLKTSLQQNQNQLEQVQSELQTKLNASQAEVAQLNSHLQHAQHQLRQVQDQLQHLQTANQHERTQTQTELSGTQAALQHLQEQFRQVQAQLQQVTQELTQSESERQASQAEIDRLKAYLQTQGSEGVMNYYRHAIASNPDALQLYHQALAIQPDDACIYLQLGKALVRQGQLTEAIASYQTALHYRPDNFEIHLELGKVLEKQKKWEDAIASYQRAIELNPDDSRSHKHLGDLLAERGQINEASLCYRRALQLQPRIF